jgi:cell division protein FtsB
MARPQGGGSRTRRIKLRVPVFLVLVALVLGLGLIRLSPPLAALRTQRERLAQLRSERAALIADRTQLRREKERLATEAGREAAARRRGYLRPGERRLMFVPEGTSERPAQ